MALVIKGGYNILRRQVLNVCLKPSTIWVNGIVVAPENYVVSELQPTNENNLEFVAFKDKHILLLNDTIIYEDKKLFNYNIKLKCTTKHAMTNSSLYTFIDFNYVGLSDTWGHKAPCV